MIYLKINKSNKNKNLILFFKNNLLFIISSNKYKTQNIILLKKILKEKLSEIGITKLFIYKKNINKWK